MKTATVVKVLGSKPGARQVIYRCNPPLEGHEYVMSSARDFGEMPKPDYAGVIDQLCGTLAVMQDKEDKYNQLTETFVFASNKDCEVEDWGELECSVAGVFDCNAPLEKAGYTVLGQPTEELN